MRELIFRKATSGDVLNLAVLKQQVWISTYAEDGIRTEFSKYVLSEITVDKTTKLIQDPDKYLLLAYNGEHLVACLEIGFKETCPEKNIEAPEIMVLYVLERFGGMGIGSMLIQKAEGIIKEHDYKGVWLTVFHENAKAIQFYKKHGYTIEGITHFEMDSNKYENKIMYKELK